jgi:hypothetical protein
MTKNGMIDLSSLSTVALAEMANEAAEQVEKTGRITVQKAIDAGRYLIAAKDQLEHGEWASWLEENWKYSQRTATVYMHISNWNHAANLDGATSVRDALRQIAENPESPKRERAATVTAHKIPPEAAVTGEKPEAYTPSPVEGTTRTATSAATVKAARATVGGKGNPESPSKPVAAELVEEDDDEPDPIDEWLASRTLEDVVLAWFEHPDDPKPAARHLRKLADRLDPPN